MAHELIITSVRKGLDGGSGYQPVLRTRGMKPAVAERLQIRSGYSHPYPHGDQRNPAVFVHRIERVAGETLHMLARICDAGSDHTGRSNFLAHLVTLEDVEARRKAAGPADVMRRMMFKTTWNEPPREADPPTVIGGDRGPGPCAAWQAVGLDPGIAGDLAEAAASGAEVRLIVREHDDVLSLFADAIALVPPAKRWLVTFNTCEIEPFDAVWRAVRDDLPQARSIRAMPGVVDLTRPGLKGSDRVYARYARGETAELPWQVVVKQVGGPAAGNDATVSHGPASGVTAEPPATVRGKGSVAATGNPSAVVPPLARAGKRNYLDRIGEGGGEVGTAGNEDGPGSVLLRYLLPAAALLLAVAMLSIVVVLQVSPPARRFVAALLSEEEGQPAREFEAGRDDSLGTEDIDLGEKKQSSREDEKKEKAEKAKEEAAEKDKADKEKRKQAEQDLERQKERQRVADEQAKARAEETKTALAKRQAAAFAAIEKMPSTVARDLPIPGGLGGGAVEPVDLGPLDVEELLDLSFSLAVPKETLGGSLFSAWVDPVEDAKPATWMIRSAANAAIELNAKPIDLAMLTAEEGRLVLRRASEQIIANPRFALLRRSVLLIKARDPAKADEKVAVCKAIQLVQPVRHHDVFTVPLVKDNERDDSSRPKKFRLPSGITIAAEANGAPPALPLDGTTIEYEVAFDYQPTGGDKNPVVYRRDLGSPPFCELLTCPPAPNVPASPPTMIGVEIAISLPAGEMRITPATNGPGKHVFDLDRIGPLVGQTDKEYEQYQSRMTISLRRRAEPLWKCSVEQFPALADQSTKLTNEYRNEITHFLERTLPDKKEEEPADPFKRWADQCTKINEEASKVSRVGTPEPKQVNGGMSSGQVTREDYNERMKSHREKWDAQYSKRLKAWYDDWVSRTFAAMDQTRIKFTPLKSPVRITFKRIAAVAYDDAGTEFPVVLAEYATDAAPAARRGTSADIQ